MGREGVDGGYEPGKREGTRKGAMKSSNKQQTCLVYERGFDISALVESPSVHSVPTPHHLASATLG